jgi:hypothetical protein
LALPCQDETGKAIAEQNFAVRSMKNNLINNPKAFVGKVLFDFNRYEF